MMPNYLFTSERLGFRTWLASDISKMAAISGNHQVMKFFPEVQDLRHVQVFVHEMNLHYSKHGYCYFAVEELEENKFIGFIGMKWIEMETESFTDIGWRLSPRFWGKGLATEGAIRCLDYGFIELGLKEIYAIAPKINTPSIQVMCKSGMQFDKEFNHPLLADAEHLQVCVRYVKRKTF